MEMIFTYGGYQLLPSVSSATQTTKRIIDSDLDIVPQQPPVQNLLPNLFNNIKSGTYKDTYVKDPGHKINITLNHSSSHG